MTLIDKQKLTFEFLEKVKEQIIADQEEKGITASGESADSLQVIEVDDGAKLVGSEHFFFQVHGRAPGRFPPKDEVLRWIDVKPITFSGIKRESLAFLIARKIAEQGTDIWRGIRAGLDIRTIVKEEAKTFRDQVGAEVTRVVKGQILTAFGL